MKKILLILSLSLAPLSAQSQTLRDQALQLLTNGYSLQSRIVAPKFAFFESCERMEAKIYGADPLDHHEREMSVMIMRKRFPADERPPRRRSVLILPPTGGINQLDVQYAEQLCDKGIEAWIITRWDKNQVDYTLDENLLSHDIAGLKGISGIRQIVQHMSGDLGVLGTSAGGILAAVALAIEPRFKAGAFIAAGADLPEIVGTSDLPALRNLRRQRMQSNQWTTREYKAQLRETVLLDPALFAPELQSKKAGIVIAFQDKTVPLRQQLHLEEVSRARRITAFDDDHFGAILKTGLLDSYKIIDFFRRSL